MLVDREPKESLVRASAVSRPNSVLFSTSAVRGIAAFLLFLLVVVTLQILSGAYGAEFGGYPDEPAHYVTSLMVRDFIAGFDWRSPMEFARNYYHYYPKVAFGHWPPFFYVVQAIWMLLFSAARASIRLEIAFTTALLAYSVYSQARRWFSGYASPVLAGLLTVCLPLVQLYADEEMAETLLTLLCFWAAVYFAKYLDSGKWQDNLKFGVFLALAVLTKGNGWLLVGIVPIAILLTRRFRAVATWQFWVGPLLVGITCVPWQLFTLDLAERGWTGGNQPSFHYTLAAIGQFGIILLELAGLTFGLMALLGLIVAVLVPALRGAVKSAPAVMFGLLISTWIFHAIVPAGVEDRKMVIAIPALILFLFAGGYWLADRLPLGYRLSRWRTQILAGAAIVVFSFEAFAIPHQQHYGYAEVAGYIVSKPEFQGKTILVSDNTVGEGLLISELAMREHPPDNVIVRGTKTFADVDWTGDNYRSLYSTPEQITQAIHNRRVDIVVVDTFGGGRDFEHNRLLREALRKTSDFQLVRSFPGESPEGKATILVYRVKS